MRGSGLSVLKAASHAQSREVLSEKFAHHEEGGAHVQAGGVGGRGVQRSDPLSPPEGAAAAQAEAPLLVHMPHDHHLCYSERLVLQLIVR
jgi:hypothetical protein